jgi:hypothetical protein
MQPYDGVTHERIAMRAYEKWCQRGRPSGSEKQDWSDAERELREEARRLSGSTTQQRR